MKEGHYFRLLRAFEGGTHKKIGWFVVEVGPPFWKQSPPEGSYIKGSFGMFKTKTEAAKRMEELKDEETKRLDKLETAPL